jgi:hypothetical protein
MRLAALIAKGEVRQGGADLRSHAFNVDGRGRGAGLGFTSLADADRNQGKAGDEKV